MKSGRLSELDRALLAYWREVSHIYCRAEVRKLKGNIKNDTFVFGEIEENAECFKIAKKEGKNGTKNKG